jgi:hypothetical protein
MQWCVIVKYCGRAGRGGDAAAGAAGELGPSAAAARPAGRVALRDAGSRTRRRQHRLLRLLGELPARSASALLPRIQTQTQTQTQIHTLVLLDTNLRISNTYYRSLTRNKFLVKSVTN